MLPLTRGLRLRRPGGLCETGFPGSRVPCGGCHHRQGSALQLGGTLGFVSMRSGGLEDTGGQHRVLHGEK